MVRHHPGLTGVYSQVKSFLTKKELKILDSTAKKEIKVFETLKNKSKIIKIDPVNKKVLSYPKSLHPKKNCAMEWWYFTGHVTSGKERFGYEFCVFKLHPQEVRFGIIPLSFIHKEPFLVAHNAITDKKNKMFTYNHDSGLMHKNKIAYNKLVLGMRDSELVLDEKENKFIINSDKMTLELKPTKNMVKHFDEGYAVLYTPPPHKTYYLSFSRLKTTGTIQVRGKEYEVTGESWFDHQKIRMHRNTTLKGWDWFSVLFDDDTELMIILMKDQNGINQKFNRGTYIKKNSELTTIPSKDVHVKSTSTWKSKKTGITYPSSWIITIPKLKINIQIKPYMNDQEIESRSTSFLSYWEGACKVTGTKAGKKINGESYVELVGYDERIMTKIIQASTK